MSILCFIILIHLFFSPSFLSHNLSPFHIYFPISSTFSFSCTHTQSCPTFLLSVPFIFCFISYLCMDFHSSMTYLFISLTSPSILFSHTILSVSSSTSILFTLLPSFLLSSYSKFFPSHSITCISSPSSCLSSSPHRTHASPQWAWWQQGKEASPKKTEQDKNQGDAPDS